MRRLGGVTSQDLFEQEDLVENGELAPSKDLAQLRATISSQCTSALPRNLNAALRRTECLQRNLNLSEQADIMNRFLPNSVQKEFSHDSAVFCVRFSPEGDLLCVASQDETVSIYETSKFSLVKTIDARDVGWSIIDIDHSPDRRWVAYSSWSDYVFLCNAFGSHELHEGLHFGTSGGMCKFGIKFSPDSREILAGCSQGYFILYDIERKTQVCITDGHSDDINSVCYVSDNPNLFATASDDTYCCVWDKRVQADDGCVGHFGGHLLGLTCVATKGDERYLLTNGKDQMMKLWDMRNLAAGRPTVRQHGGFGFDYRYQRFSSQGRRLRSDTSLLTFSGHHIQRTLIRCNFSPVACSGQRFVYSGCASGRVVVYDTLIGEMVHTIHSHNSIVRDVSWHPTFPSIATASWDGTCKVFSYKG